MPVDPQRIQAVFQAAVECARAERAALLGRECAQDDELRHRVEVLLQAHDNSAELPDAGVTGAYDEASPTRLQPGQVFAGRYKLREKLGEGGMGTVYVADQLEPVQRRVALKVLKSGLDSASALARFEQERQALALMDHPNIAKVFDAGTVGHVSNVPPAGHVENVPHSGTPFFIMELVKGIPITKFCDQEHLTPKERLELFIPVCQAVQHAHQKGIIHRDLKPSNVLIALYDGKPVPKVIDFGVAKATGQRLADHTIYTEAGSIVGTLEYMAPEQAELNNLDIDTRADIYSLGVLLYELLTGSPPFTSKQLRSAGFVEMLRLIKEVEPPRPSTKLSSSVELPSIAANRKLDPKKLTRLVLGDLDWIVMKALEKDRARRYETANGFAMDVQRYLADEPVLAGPPSVGYKLRKFVRRNRPQVIAAGLVLLALVGGIAGTSWGLVRAENQRRLAEHAAEAEREAKVDAQAKKAEAETQQARAEAGEKLAGERLAQVEAEKQKAEEEKRIAQAVRDFLQHKLLGQADSRTQADALLRAGGLAAEAKENPTIRELLDRAAKELAEDKIEANFPNQPLLQAEILHTVGNTYRGVGEHERAIRLLERSTALWKQHLGTDQPDTLAGLNNLAVAYQAAGKLNEAIKLLEQVRDARVKTLGADHPDTLTTLGNLAGAYLTAGRLKEAITLFEQARDAFVKQLEADDPSTLTTMNNLAVAYQTAGRLKEALALLEQVRDAQVKTLGADHPSTLTTLNSLALRYTDAGRLKEAITLFEQVRDARVKTLGADHPDTHTTLHCLAWAHMVGGKLKDAIALLEQVRDTRVKRLGADHLDTLTTLHNLAELYRQAGKLNEAIALFEQVHDAQGKKLGADHPNTLATLNGLALAYIDAAKPRVAVALLEQVRDAQVKKLGANHPSTLTTLNNLAGAYWKAMQLDKSVPLFEDVLKRQESTLGRQHPSTQTAVANLGINYKDAGRLAEALPLLEEAHRESRKFPTLRWVGSHLLDAYVKAGQSAEAVKLVQEVQADARKDSPKDSPQLAGTLAQLGSALLQLKAYNDAEPLLRESLAIREKKEPDAWTTFDTKSMLGGALLGQKKYADADPLLLQGYEGMKERETKMPKETKVRLTEALERLVQLYEAMDKKDEAAKWRGEFEAAKGEREKMNP